LINKYGLNKRGRPNPVDPEGVGGECSWDQESWIRYFLTTYSLLHIEFSKVAGAKQTLIEKKSENEMVLSEFNLLSPDASIFKLVGPILAKQDIGESKANVQKRVEYIAKEIQRMD